MPRGREEMERTKRHLVLVSLFWKSRPVSAQGKESIRAFAYLNLKLSPRKLSSVFQRHQVSNRIVMLFKKNFFFQLGKR